MNNRERDPVAFVQRALASLPADPADAGQIHFHALRRVEARLPAVVERANRALDEVWAEVEDYIDQIPSIHSARIVVRSTTTVRKHVEEVSQR